MGVRVLNALQRRIKDIEEELDTLEAQIAELAVKHDALVSERMNMQDALESVKYAEESIAIQLGRG